MKTDIWPDNVSVLEMTDWLAELREDGRAKARGDRHAEPPDEGGLPRAHTSSKVGRHSAHTTHDHAGVPAHSAAAQARAAARMAITARAVIGDRLRIPIMWCEMGSCVSWHADPAALGEADVRARAIAAGWRVDALDRLTCPRCQQTSPWFWATQPVVLWDRNRAVTGAALMAAVAREGAVGRARGPAAATDVNPAVEPALVPLPARERRREDLARSGPAL